MNDLPTAHTGRLLCFATETASSSFRYPTRGLNLPVEVIAGWGASMCPTLVVTHRRCAVRSRTLTERQSPGVMISSDGPCDRGNPCPRFAGRRGGLPGSHGPSRSEHITANGCQEVTQRPSARSVGPELEPTRGGQGSGSRGLLEDPEEPECPDRLGPDLSSVRGARSCSRRGGQGSGSRGAASLRP